MDTGPLGPLGYAFLTISPVVAAAPAQSLPWNHSLAGHVREGFSSGMA